MRANTMQAVTAALVLALALAVGGAGCGPKGGGTTVAGKGAGKTGTGPATAKPGGGGAAVIETTPEGGVTITAKVVDVKEETKDHFRKVVAKLEDARKTGTLKDKCGGIADDFKGVTEKDPTFLDGAFNAGAVNLECGNESAAETAFRDLIRRYPDYGRAYGGLATILHKRGKEAEAREWYGKCLEKDPTVVECNLNMASLLFKDYEGTKNPDILKDAVKKIRTALAVDASSMAAYALFAYVYYSLDQLRLAGLVCQQAKKYDENYAPVWNVLGLIELKNKNVTAALSHFKTAVAKDPDYVPGLINWGAITINYRDYDTAIEKFERAIKIGGDDYDVWLTLGVAYRGKGTGLEDLAARREWLNKSKAAYEKAASLKPSEPAPYYNLGLLWENYKLTDDDNKNLNTAISMYEKFASMSGGRKDLEKLKKDAERRAKVIRDLLKALAK
jgi:tetratricopeptide (TPR) repeat protein